MSSILRVLHVVASMDAGGIETMLMNIYRKIDKSKIQFDFLVHRDFKFFYEDEIISNGGRIHRLIPIKLLSLRKYIYDLGHFFESHSEYCLVHSHISVMSCLIHKVAKKRKVPYRLAHSHEAHKSLREHKLYRRPVIFIAKKYINRYVTHRFSCSEESGVWLFGERNDIKVISNAIDAKKYIYDKNSINNTAIDFDLCGKFVVGHIGNFSKAKNYPFILEVFRSIHAKNNNSVLMLVGKNEANPAVKQQVRDMGLQNHVIFTGVRSDIPDLLRAMDVFLFPSLHEGLPVSLVEAQASGLKCLVSDSVTQEVKITGHVEFLSLDESPLYWAEKALKFQDGYERENTYEDIVRAGYDIEENVKWLEKFYLECSGKSE